MIRCLASVGVTKNASPAAPSFILTSTSLPFTQIVTCVRQKQASQYHDTIFSLLRNSCSLPKRTWKGVLAREPSFLRTTMTSIAPLNVAAFSSKGLSQPSQLAIVKLPLFCNEFSELSPSSLRHGPKVIQTTR